MTALVSRTGTPNATDFMQKSHGRQLDRRSQWQACSSSHEVVAREHRRQPILILSRSTPERAGAILAVMTTIGLIGAGHIGSQVARLAVANGCNVVISNSRGPETLAALVAELGPNARAATPFDAAKAADIAVVTIPLKN